MAKYQLNSNDYQYLKDLIEIGTKIEYVYNDLYNLEINKKDNSSNYQKHLDLLKALINEENNITNRAGINSRRDNALNEYILSRIIKQEFPTNEKSIGSCDYRYRVLRRILNKNTMINMDVYVKDQVDQRINSKNVDDNRIANAIHSSVLLLRSISYDLLTGFLFFLQEEIDKTENINILNELIKSKYNLAFMNKLIEEDLIDKNFAIRKPLYFSSMIISEVLDFKNDVFNSIKDLKGVKTSVNQINHLLKINDDYYQNSNVMISTIISSCLIRSAFLLMKSQSLIKINDSLITKYNEDDYLNDTINNQMTRDIIAECFLKTNEDHENLCTLSLKPF